MIRPCRPEESEEILSIINDAAAQAYRGVIPPDRWHDPYMSVSDFNRAKTENIRFWGYEEKGILLGVMGIQEVQDVTLIRHAYVRTANRSQGIGGKLLEHLKTLTDRPVLIGTWASASWAVRFYQKHGYELVSEEAKNILLKVSFFVCISAFKSAICSGNIYLRCNCR